jgi:transposase
MYLCEEWNDLTVTPCDKQITSQRISDLFKQISYNDRMEFFKKWGKVRAEQEYIAFDITSISSYSKLIEMVETGYNRDEENLPQINLGMLFGETSLLPIFYNLYPGSINDVKTLSNMLKLTEFLEMKEMKFVMDKGFFSKINVDEMMGKSNKYKFSVAVPFSTSFAKDAVDAARENIGLPSNAIIIKDEIIQAVTINQKWGTKKIYTHVYFNKDKYATDEKALLKKILLLEQEILSQNRVSTNEIKYEKYFKIRNLKSGINVQRIDENIKEVLKYKGYFVVISNDIKNANEALEIYRNKDVVEKSFDNLKNELDLNRLRIHSDKAMDGRIFIGFIALILQSHIHKVMKTKDLYKKFTKEKLLYEVKKIKRIEFANKKPIITEISKKQRDIFAAFDIPLPSQ